MWLLDVNMPNKLVRLLGEFGIEAQTTHDRDWDTLTNGRLLEAAASAGFLCLLTRDKLFGDFAAKALRQFPYFSVVVVALPQVREQQFLSAFRKAWTSAPILSVPGRMIRWP